MNFNRLKILFFLIVIFSSANSFGQSITWTKTYSGPYNFIEECHSLCQSSDGNFFALGFSFDSVHSLNDLVLIMKINPYGDTLWSKIVPNLFNKIVTSSIPTEDGGCVFTGRLDTAFAVKIDMNGNIVWRKNYGITSYQIFNIIKTLDNGYLLCGNQLYGSWHGLIIKIDSLGNLQWTKTYTSTFYKNFGSATVFDQNNYILAGTVADKLIDTQHITITKINLNGEVVWEKRYLINETGGNGKKILKINNNFIISGTTNNLTNGVSYFFTIDTSGTKLYEHKFESNKNEALWDMKIVNTNKIVFAMTRDSLAQLKNSKVILSDTLGNIISEKVFRVPRNSGRIWLESILLQNNGDFIFGGFSELYNDSTDFFLTRTDSILNVPPIGISNNNYLITDKFGLLEPYPNPFNPTTNIRFEIPKSAEVNIKVYDILGKEIFTYSEYKQAGRYEIEFDGSNLASGVYFYTLKAETSHRDVFTETKRMVLLK